MFGKYQKKSGQGVPIMATMLSSTYFPSCNNTEDQFQFEKRKKSPAQAREDSLHSVSNLTSYYNSVTHNTGTADSCELVNFSACELYQPAYRAVITSECSLTTAEH